MITTHVRVDVPVGLACEISAAGSNVRRCLAAWPVTGEGCCTGVEDRPVSLPQPRGFFSRTTAAAPLSWELIIGRAWNCSRCPDLKLGGFLGSFVFGSLSELSLLFVE